MNFMKKNLRGILLCLIIAIPSWLLGKLFPVIGGAVISILVGMIIAMFWNDKGKAESGIKWTSKAVSYTHLDVYKRQFMDSFREKMNKVRS